jgi:hypothetical protein
MDNGCFDAMIKCENIERICCVYQLAYDLLVDYLRTNANYKVNELVGPDTANQVKLIISGFRKTFEVVLLFPATRSRHKGALKDRQHNKVYFYENSKIAKHNFKMLAKWLRTMTNCHKQATRAAILI